MPDYLKEILTQSGFRNYVVDSEEVPENGLVFCYPLWSSSCMILKSFSKHLEERDPGSPLYTYDIDTTAYQLFAQRYNFISHGRGELVYLRDGSIVAAIERYKGNVDEEISIF